MRDAPDFTNLASRLATMLDGALGAVAEAVLARPRHAVQGRRDTFPARGDRAPAETPDRAEGEVAIVGAGPGDPELLTFKAVRHLRRADVVVHDRLVAPEIVEHARDDAERVFVGKARGRKGCSQDDINATLVAYARQGLKVVRLKGGDPFIFGRGGEECEHLAAHGVPVTVVPGITAASGCAASAGLPLTDRRHASAVTFLTGHPHDADGPPDWGALATSGQTLAVYMGVGSAGATAERLMAHGRAPATPAAVVERGTMPDQRVLATTLGGLSACVAEHGVQPPALLVIGEVAQVLGAQGEHSAETRCPNAARRAAADAMAA